MIGLAPENKNPVALTHCVEGLRYLLTEGYSPSKIVVMGDSAGANLALGVMSHILHPSPDIDPLQLSSPLAGLLCISPCLAFNFRAPSYDENAKNDFLSIKQIKRFLEAYLPLTYQREFYSEPLEAPISWWKGFPAKSALLLAGDLEIMRDDAVKFAKKISGQIPGFEFLVCKNEVHVGCAADFALGAERLTMTQTSWSWFQKTFHSS